MAASLRRLPSAANPLDLRSADLPRELALVARLLAVLLILSRTRPWDVFLPYVPWLDPAADPWILAAFRVGLVLVLITPWVRPGCALVGLSLMLGLLGNRPSHSVAHTFVAWGFLMLALSPGRREGFLLRAQVILVYAAAGLNKAVDPDWWNGGYVDTLLAERERHPGYLAAASHLPPLLFAQALGIGAILIEFALAACFAAPRWYGAGVALAVLFHGALLLLLNQTFGPFLGALLIVFLLFLPAPECFRLGAGFPALLARALQASDPSRGYERAPDGLRLGLEAVGDGTTLKGGAAWALMLTRHPLFAAGLVGLLTVQRFGPWPRLMLVVGLMSVAAVSLPRAVRRTLAAGPPTGDPRRPDPVRG